MEPIVLVHGGAGDIPASRVPLKLSGCKKAVNDGYKVLAAHGSALDAVEAAVRVMEDDPAFNAGYGSVLNLDGEVEMDASVMVGDRLEAGAVTIVKDVAHPISLARLIMEKSPHVLLGADGAKRFAINHGVQILPPGSLVTEQAKEALAYFKKHGGDFTEIGCDRKKGEVGTVGAVAIDSNGLLAVATSTGGISGKLPGRCSDTSQIGGGSYADNCYGAVSTTGYGEAILRFCLAHAVVKEIASGKTAQRATEDAVEAMTKQFNKTAGAITISNSGSIGIHFSSKRMAWAYRLKNEVHFGIEREQHEIEKLQN
ncbi:probable isoaspartyl peptidase/L-asparaginase GA20639 isoform X1 [Photinus pyralis]|nr:probable isoaspartyl peptidase/L-asparaginase GA20639 isoform X1 [Photinus pyralis]